MKLIKLGKKLIGEKQKTFITFEAGPTHNGYSSAKKLIESAAKSSHIHCNAILQSYRRRNLFKHHLVIKIPFEFYLRYDEKSKEQDIEKKGVEAN